MFEELEEKLLVKQTDTRGEDVGCNLKYVAEENAALKKRCISSLKEYRSAVESNRNDTDYEESFLDIDFEPFNLSRILSFLTINELLTVRCVSRKLRNWCEFELKCHKEIFVITDKHKSDYEIFLNFKLFPNVTTLVIEKLPEHICLRVLHRLCKDFLTQLKYIVLYEYEKMRVFESEIFDKVEMTDSGDPLAQKLLANLRKNINLFNGDSVTILTVNGLQKISEDEIEEIERLQRQNNFLRDKSELLEKECQRIKNCENVSLFSMLPEETLVMKILDMLSVSELFSLRLVSKEMKQWAEITIRSHKQRMYINLKMHSTFHIHLWSNLYSKIKKLTIRGSGVDLEVLLRICENKFPYLTSLFVYSCEKHNIDLFGDYFPMIQKLRLSYDGTVGEGIARLLSKLSQLNTLSVYSSVNTAIAPFFAFGRNTTNLKSFTYECYSVEEINCKDIGDSLVPVMPNLTALHLNLFFATLQNFSDLQLLSIKELDLCCSRLEGCFTLPQNVVSVTKLILNMQRNSAEEIAAVLVNFTNLKTLELGFSLNDDIPFNATLMEALVGLNSLKYFSLFGHFYSNKKYYTLNEGEKSALVEVLVALKNIDKIKIEFSGQIFHADYLVEFVTAVNKLRAKRPQQSIQLIIPEIDFDLMVMYDDYDQYDDYGGEY